MSTVVSSRTADEMSSLSEDTLDANNDRHVPQHEPSPNRLATCNVIHC